jgi:alpha-beta hydrolase superfamily lysophospholipase
MEPPTTEAAIAPFAPSIATARMADGTILRTVHWPEPDDPWATALLVHGLGEHAGRYANVAEPLVAAGLDVHGYDQRGFGASAGRRAYVDHWSDFHDDLEARVTSLRAAHPDLPLVLYGHSMGGLVATGYVLSDRPRPLPDLLVLSSPALDDAYPAWQRSLVSGLNRLVPKMAMANGGLGDKLSHDPAIREAYLADPLNLQRSTVRLGHEGFVEQALVHAAVEAIDAMPMPTYVFHGAEDAIVPVAASAAIGGKRNVTRHVHDGLRHETHHEAEHQSVMAEVVAWLEAQRPSIGGDRASAAAAATVEV